MNARTPRIGTELPFINLARTATTYLARLPAMIAAPAIMVDCVVPEWSQALNTESLIRQAGLSRGNRRTAIIKPRDAPANPMSGKAFASRDAEPFISFIRLLISVNPIYHTHGYAVSDASVC
ncbi:MAG: hypothetical protein QM684_05210 [Rhizobium sp.]